MGVIAQTQRAFSVKSQFESSQARDLLRKIFPPLKSNFRGSE